MRTRLAAVIALAAAIALPALAIAQDAPDPAPADPYLDCTSESEPANFTTYSLGASFQGLEATTVLRRCDPPYPGEPARANFVSFIYGDCEAITESCTPPLEVQSWPACERALADYEIAPGVPYPSNYTGEEQGVPAHSFDGGTRLELYTGESTVVIFGEERATTMDAAAEIAAEPTSEEPSLPTDPGTGDPGPLPEPEPGAIEGELSCAQ